MRPFELVTAEDPNQAVALLSEHPDASYLGGGTNLVDHLRLGVATPTLVVDVRRLPLGEVERSEDGGLRIGATVPNADLAAHPVVRRDYPMLSRALLAGASGQIRNAATTAGNLLQRTRCAYFQDVTTPCNKREPGSGCSAVGGYTRYHAIFGASESCLAVHPSDMAVALAALDATVVVLGPAGERRIPVVDLHRLPGDEPDRDTVLAHGDLITAVELPAPSGAKSTYRKVRDRASFAFALVSVAASLDVEGGTVREARIAFGGVAHKPWRAHLAEDALAGVALDPDDPEAQEQAFLDAADAELAQASPVGGAAGDFTEGNEFKVGLLRNTLVSVLRELSAADSGAESEGTRR
ncbi:MAG TPA: xanthine dehydrogenase family protein subunit M [Nocardioidaceae bacterium]|nr:xanthine dehydrogenase family protein subunit M [Nocardioidaceae bacterium]